MSIDIERLKVDREYWDSVAPEGATHYQVNSTWPWERVSPDNHCFHHQGGWFGLGFIGVTSGMIPRPGLEPKQ